MTYIDVISIFLVPHYDPRFVAQGTPYPAYWIALGLEVLDGDVLAEIAQV